MFKLTAHAKQQIIARKDGDIIDRDGNYLGSVSDIVSEDMVLQAIEKHTGVLRRLDDTDEVRVVVQKFDFVIHAPDGSNGDLVVACVNPNSRNIKTVMLQRRSQARKKSQQVPYLV